MKRCLKCTWQKTLLRFKDTHQKMHRKQPCLSDTLLPVILLTYCASFFSLWVVRTSFVSNIVYQDMVTIKSRSIYTQLLRSLQSSREIIDRKKYYGYLLSLGVSQVTGKQETESANSLGCWKCWATELVVYGRHCISCCHMPSLVALMVSATWLFSFWEEHTVVLADMQLSVG